jgi:class I fructose-bisphosphate aldolase
MLAKRVAHVMQASFAGKRVAVFPAVGPRTEMVCDEVRSVRHGGGNGSLIGRNTFPRPRGQVVEMLNKVIDIYPGRV